MDFITVPSEELRNLRPDPLLWEQELVSHLINSVHHFGNLIMEISCDVKQLWLRTGYC